MRMPLGSELLRQSLGDVEQRRAGGAVVDHQTVRVEEGVDRGDVDNRAASLVDHVRDGRAGRAKRGEEVELEGALEVVVAHLEEAVQSQLDAADVVHEHVDSAVPLDRLLDEPL